MHNLISQIEELIDNLQTCVLHQNITEDDLT